MKHSVHHDLGQERAKQVAQAAFQSYRDRFAKYEPQATWVNERHADISFQVKGLKLNGSLDVNPSDIEMDLDVPFVLRPFKGKALGMIEAEINKWISKAKTGQL